LEETIESHYFTQQMTRNKPTQDLTITEISYVEEDGEDLIPELAYLLSRPADFSEGVSGSPLQVTFDAYAEAGQRPVWKPLLLLKT
jgi:hypothetical protein